MDQKDEKTKPASARWLSTAPDLPPRNPPVCYGKTVPDACPEASGEASRPLFSRRVSGLGIDAASNDPVEELCVLHAETGQPPIDLINTNPTTVGLDYSPYTDCWIHSAANQDLWHYRPDPAGLLEIRQSIATHYLRAYGLALDPQQMLLTASTSEGYAVLFELLTDPGDHILISRPGYPLMDVIATNAGLELDSYPLVQGEEGHWHPDLQALTANLHPRTRAIVCVSPHNPTGSVLSQADWQQLDQLCLRHNLSLLVDEVFRDYSIFETSHHNEPFRTQCRCYILNGMSKLAALPQLKLAWIYLGGTLSSLGNGRGRLEYLLDARLSVSNFAQICVPELLANAHLLQQQIRERILRNQQLLADFATGSGVPYHPYFGGWYGLLGTPEHWRGADASLLLARHCGVKVHPGFFYDLPESIAIGLSLITPPHDFQNGLQRFTKQIQSRPRILIK